MRITGATIVALAACASAPPPVRPTTPWPVSEIEAFNRSFHAATMAMDTPGLVALWEDDGVSLLPGSKPLVGKQAIAEFVENVMRTMPDAHMTKFEMSCAGIEIAANTATEYCFEHQVVDLGAGKPPFDGKGTMLLVLHRHPDGTWHLWREMWNQGLEP